MADRLYILATLIGLGIRDIIPWWLVIFLLLRDVMLLATGPSLRRLGLTALPVHFIGKAATFNLLYAFPLLLLGDGTGAWNEVARVVRLGLRHLGDRPVLVGRAARTSLRSAS